MIGFPIEDKTRAYLLSTWNTYPNSELATSNPKFDTLLQPLLASGESNLETHHHILPDVEYLSAIKAPLTEISTFRLLPGLDFAAGQQQMDDTIAEIKTHTPRAKGIHAPIVWGRAGGVDVSAPSVMLIGWDDVEVRDCRDGL
ncbi:hypothetical protein CPC08DRAFT_158475 [Agrocybe pediades]|nr:hypothetical protein CPC08DRAFT_158475 [Agrocybe pediades]